MKNSNIFLCALFIVLCLGFFSCQNDLSTNDDSSSTTTGSTSTSSITTTYSYVANTSDRDITSAVYDVGSVTFSNTVYIRLDDLYLSTDGSTFSAQSTDKNSPTTVLTGVTAYTSDSVLYINSESYKANLKLDISGTASTEAIDITANKSYAVELYLNGATITSSGYYPCINVDSKSTVYLCVNGTNSFTDGRSYGYGYGDSKYESTSAHYVSTGSNTKGSIYTKGPLILTQGSGTGSLTLTEGYKHGFYSKDYIRVFSGTYTVNSTGRNAFQSVNGFVMDGGSITISGTGTNTNNESRGIIVEGSEDNPGEGFIVINDGTITSTTVSKGISAKWDIDEDYGSSDTSDDPYPYVKITGGTITITTTGTPKDESSSESSVMDADGVSANETTKLSPEGIEGKQDLFITGGSITLNTTDDCINASRDTSGYAARVVISGGEIYAYSSGNDAIDSNGTLTISGGTIVALTATNPECAFDCDSNTFTITGGTFVGIGTSNYSSPTSSVCTQSTVVLSGDYFGVGGTNFAIEDSSGDAVFAYSIPSSIFGTSAKSSYVMILSSPEIAAGTTYKAVKAVSVSGGSAFNGLYTTLPTVSGGSSTVTGISTSTSSYVYTKSSSTNGGAQEGLHP